jgi:glycosyltransferase involved in cell wall biosynthesis
MTARILYLTRAMPKITALLHTHNDAPRIGRALDSLRACDEVLVVDHGSTDDTVHVARHHGATVEKGVPGVNFGVYAIDTRHDWIFCLLPTEAVAESLEAALFEWKQTQDEPSDQSEKDKQAAFAGGFAVRIREETASGWRNLAPEVRLVNRKKVNWPGRLPPNSEGATVLGGELLRFEKP